MHLSKRRHWFAALGAIALITLACACSLGEQLAGGWSDTAVESGDGNSDTQSGETRSVQATLNPNPESALTPTELPPTEHPLPEPRFQNVYFSSALDEAEGPVGVALSFPSGVTEVYAFTSWSGMQDGMPAKSVWMRDGEVVAESEVEWSLGPAGDDAWIGNLYSETGALMDGDYTWELSIMGEPMASGTFSVGTQASILLQDDFSDPNSGWEIGEYDTGRVGYEGGSYAVSATREDLMMWGLANDVFQDLDIQVEATQVQAPPNNNNAYGVMCRVREGGTGYLLRISGDGFFSITLAEQADSFQPLVDWQPSDAIRQGNSTNLIGAICEGDYFALYVNGELLAEARDDSFPSGDIALTTTSFETGASKVLFDNIIASSR